MGQVLGIHTKNSTFGPRPACRGPIALTHLSSCCSCPQPLPWMFSLPNQVCSGYVCQGGRGRSVCLCWHPYYSDILPLLCSGIYSPPHGQGWRGPSELLSCTFPTWIGRWLHPFWAAVLV